MNKFEQNIFNNLNPIVEANSIELCDVEFRKINDEDNLTVFLYTEDGITLDDCEKIHNLIDPVLDQLDPTKGEPYRLNVSSLGLDRPFKTNRDFERYLGLPVELKFYKKIDGKKWVNGVLADFNDEIITLDINDKIFEFDKKDIALARPYVEF